MFDAMLKFVLVFTAISLFILIVGLITSRNLPPKKKKSHIRKFAAIALLPISFGIYTSKPSVSWHSRTEIGFEEQQTDNLNSTKEIAEYEKNQLSNIKLLKEEVEDVRKDLAELEKHYTLLLAVFFGFLWSLAFILFFKKDKEDEEEKLVD